MATKNCMLGLACGMGFVTSVGVASKCNHHHRVRLISFAGVFHHTVEMTQVSPSLKPMIICQSADNF